MMRRIWAIKTTYAAITLASVCLLSTMLLPVHQASAQTAFQTLPARTNTQQNDLQQLVDQAYTKFKGLNEGMNADYIPELSKVPSDLFGVVIATADGRLFTAGDVDYVFSIQSVAKPFTAALVMHQRGAQALQQMIGVEPTGFPFNSIEAIALEPQRSSNPLVNAGAIAAVSMLEAKTPESRYKMIEDWLSQFAGSKLSLLKDIYQSEAANNQGNRAIAALLNKYERIYADPQEAVDVYTRVCSIGVDAKQLAIMGATLANNGINPITKVRVLEKQYVPKLLAVMTMAGFYNESGLWAYNTGLPAKTGVGGGIVAVIPGKMSIVGFSPRLNQAGNSVRASKAIEFIASELGANIFNAAP